MKKDCLAELKAENEQLKALCDTYKTCYQAKHNDIDGKLFKYRQTLQEIKDIAEENRDTSQYGGICKSILALITKAEGEG